MSELVITGTIAEIGQVQVISEKFSKLEFVIETGGQYSKTICFQAVNDNVKKLDNLASGQEVEIKFNLESKKSGERWFTNATAWSIKILAGTQQALQPVAPNTQNVYPPVVSPVAEGDKDDLPF